MADPSAYTAIIAAKSLDLFLLLHVRLLPQLCLSSQEATAVAAMALFIQTGPSNDAVFNPSALAPAIREK